MLSLEDDMVPRPKPSALKFDLVAKCTVCKAQLKDECGANANGRPPKPEQQRCICLMGLSNFQCEPKTAGHRETLSRWDCARNEQQLTCIQVHARGDTGFAQGLDSKAT